MRLENGFEREMEPEHRLYDRKLSPDMSTTTAQKSAQQVFSFTRELPTIQREPTDLRVSRHQVLPAIGMSFVPENDEEEDILEMGQQSSRFISPPSPPRAQPQPKRLNNVKLDLDSPKRRTKVTLKFNNKNKRFEPVTRRATAGVHQLPPIRRTTQQCPETEVTKSFDSDYIYELPERPEAPEPNRTPPLDDSDIDGKPHCLSSGDDEPIDYIDED